jgi:hypothetical protein
VRIAKDGKGFPPFQGCRTDPTHAREVFDSQNCYETAHATDAWSSPFMATIRERLQERGGKIPDTVMTHNFHKDDMRRSIDMMIYSLPETRLIPANETWESSVLHPAAIMPNTPLSRFVEEEIDDARIWNQIFQAQQ